MRKNLSCAADFIITCSFYCLFFFLPLVYSGDTSEVFELNKTWLLYILTITIAITWICKSIAQNKITVRHTIFTLPLFLFLLSQTVSTLTSIDTHLSLWGSYGRFTGGYLSTLASMFLFFAFVSNIKERQAKNTIAVAFVSGCIVLTIGYLAFFGYDNICNSIAATPYSSCWVDPTGPKTRMFSTIGNPNWLASYLAILLPLSITMFLKNFVPQTITGKKNNELGIMNNGLTKNSLPYSLFIILYSILLYVALLLTGSRSGFIGFLCAFSFLLVTSLVLCHSEHSQVRLGATKNLRRMSVLLLFIFIILSALIGTPFTKRVAFMHTPNTMQPMLANGGEASIQTRLFLWHGTLAIFSHYPIFGSGVETFALTYPQYRPVQHNMTKEWNFVYDKAHNEYLSLLVNTGLVGLTTYLLFIGSFLYTFYVSLLHKQKSTISLLPLVIFSSWLGILVTNFFGFADAVANLFFYLLPALHTVLTADTKTYTFTFAKKPNAIIQSIAVCLAIVIGGYGIVLLLERWYADAKYTFGYRADQQGTYLAARPHLLSAMYYWPTEPTFANELAKNSGYVSVIHNQGGQKKLALAYAEQAKNLSNTIVTTHIYSSELWEDRAFLFAYLAQTNPYYRALSIAAAKEATILSPTSAAYRYVLFLQYKDASMLDKAKKTLQETLVLKPDYKEALQQLMILKQIK